MQRSISFFGDENEVMETSGWNMTMELNNPITHDVQEFLIRVSEEALRLAGLSVESE